MQSHSRLELDNATLNQILNEQWHFLANRLAILYHMSGLHLIGL